VVETTMELSSWLRKRVEEASPDLLRAMVQEMAEALMGAEADALCGAGYGERTPERLNRRNGYRERGWDTRVGTIELAVPKLRAGSYFPDWLLPRRRAEQAFAVNRDGVRESLGLDVVTSEDGAAWLAFVRSLVARGLAGVKLVTSDAHPGLVDAIAATLPGN
jgi:transposase-like protein